MGNSNIPNWHESYGLVMTVIAAAVLELEADKGIMAGQAFLAMVEETSDQYLAIAPDDDPNQHISKETAKVLLGLLRTSVESRLDFEIDREAF